MHDLSIIILNYKTRDLTLKCLDSIFEKKWQTDFEVWLVDNASDDRVLEEAKRKYPKINCIQSPINGGYSAGNNLGLKKINSKIALILNSDIIVENQAIDNLVAFIDQSDFGIGSGKLINPDKSFQPNAGDLPYFWSVFNWVAGLDDFLPFFKKIIPSFHRKYLNYYSNSKEVGWVSGSAIIIKKQVVDKIGFLDERIFMYGEDTDYCFRAKKAGFKIGWTNQAEFIHIGGASSEEPHFKQWIGEFRGLIYFYKKHFGVVQVFLLKIIFYKFIIARIIAFAFFGKLDFSKTYAKILINI